MNLLFGTMIEMLSFVTMTVARAPMRWTVPALVADFDAIADRDRPFGQNDEAADEVARDALQADADADADRAGEDGERAKIDPGLRQHNQDADDQDDVADDLRERVLQRAVQAAVDEEAVEEEALRC